MKKLTVDHFLQAHEMMAGYYGTTAPDIKGIAIAFKSLTAVAPWLTQEQFDWALARAIAQCKFHPRIPDILEQVYERDCSSLPPMPDIDPKYADEYQLGVYHRALAQRNKQMEHVGFDGNIFRKDVLGQIPGTKSPKLEKGWRAEIQEPRKVAGFDDDKLIEQSQPDHEADFFGFGNAQNPSGWDSQGPLDHGGSRSTVSGLDNHNGRQQNANIPF